MLKRLISGGLTVAALSCVRAIAADGISPLPVKASAAPYYDWTGFYVGGHLGYATGYSKWSATEAGADVPSLAGSLDYLPHGALLAAYHDTAHDYTVGEHVVIAIVPLTSRAAADRRAL